MTNRFSFYIFLWMLPLFLKGQSSPFLHFYSNEVYNAGAVNWKIAQSPEGIMYFANNDGLLEFDGSHWNTYALPGKTNVRSIHYKEGRIYAGGQSEFGYYQNEVTGELKYVSLLDKLPAPYRNFEDVWDIHSTDSHLFFRASNKIYSLDLEKENVKVWSDQTYLELESLDNKIYTQFDDGVYSFDSNAWQSTGASLPSLLKGVFNFGNEAIFVSQKDGLFLQKNRALPKAFEAINAMLIANQCFDVVQHLNGDLLFATAFSGAIVCSADGQIKNVIDKTDGLGSNSIPAAFIDKNANLWLGLDKGVSFIETTSLFSRVFPDGELQGSGQAIATLNGVKYFSTNNGVFKLVKDVDEVPGFQLVENTEGQTWGLDVVDGQIILSHGEGLFVIKNNRAEKLTNDPFGYWQFFKSKRFPELLYAGTYNGVQQFENGSNSLRKTQTTIDLEESSRFLEEDNNGDLWMSHPYRGLFRIENLAPGDAPKVVQLGSNDGLLSNVNNHVFKIKNEIFVCAEKGIYFYNAKTKKLEPHEQLNQLIGAEIKTRRLFESPEGNLWYITDNDVGFIKIETGIVENKVLKKTFPEIRKKLNTGFEKLFFVSENDIYFTANNGFLHYNPQSGFNGEEDFEIVLREALANNEKVALVEDGQNLHLVDSEEKTLGHKNNNLAFTVGATSYLQYGSLEYQYFLEGFDETWTKWTGSGTKEYTNLPSGDYTFHVRARNFNKQIEEKTIASFQIDAPWYKSKAAYLLAFILLSGLLFAFYRRSNNKISAIAEEADNSIQMSRLEVQRLENEKIQQELAHKNRELISATAHLLKKNETIESLTNELVLIKKKVPDQDSSSRIERLIQVLKTDTTKDQDWDQFMMHFNDLNKDFFVRLKNEYPRLTPKDLKLCAYLKMNLSSKEIATLLNVSVRGVEASRYRLRKKMSLGSDQNITELMLQY